ncbi:hypothetical protein HanOQP8_Chr01g0005521 [Helianthus annuus]|nr:hypothetical protein HanOQP8_Chr01g0005521 [Helianthus annuus]
MVRPNAGLLTAILDMLVEGKFDLKKSPVIRKAFPQVEEWGSLVFSQKVAKDVLLSLQRIGYYLSLFIRNGNVFPFLSTLLVRNGIFCA